MLINMLGFNVAWFGLLYWGNLFIPFAVIMVTLHFIYFSKIKHETRLVLLITIIGASVDSILHFFDFFNFPGFNFMPLWLVMLWVCFASTICHSLNFLSSSKVLQVLIGGLLAPLSYLAGANFNAVTFTLPFLQTYIILALIWACLFSLFYFLKNQLTSKEQAYA